MGIWWDSEVGGGSLGRWKGPVGGRRGDLREF